MLSASLCPLWQSKGPRVSLGSSILAWFCGGAGVAAAWHHLGEQPCKRHLEFSFKTRFKTNQNVVMIKLLQSPLESCWEERNLR